MPRSYYLDELAVGEPLVMGARDRRVARLHSAPDAVVVAEASGIAQSMPWGRQSPGYSMLAQGITLPADTTILGAAARIGTNGAPVDAVIAQIRPDNGGVPAATILATSEGIAGPSLPAYGSIEANLAWQTLAFPSGIELDGDVLYWLVIARITLATNDYYQLSAGANNYEGGAAYGYVSGTSSWLSVGGDFAFRLYSGAVPAMTATPLGVYDLSSGATLDDVPEVEMDGPDALVTIDGEDLGLVAQERYRVLVQFADGVEEWTRTLTVLCREP